MDGRRLWAVLFAPPLPNALMQTLRQTPAPARCTLIGTMGLGLLVALALLCLTAGRLAPAPMTSRAADGRWYWIVSEHTGYTVSSKAKDRCGMAVYVGMERAETRGLGLFITTQSHRVWWVDPHGDMSNPDVLGAVRSRMREQGLHPHWIGALDVRGRVIDERLWIGELLTGAVLVLPGLMMALALARFAGRAAGDFHQWRAERANRCLVCRYSLDGLEEEAGACPECGSPRRAAGTPQAA